MNSFLRGLLTLLIPGSMALADDPPPAAAAVPQNHSVQVDIDLAKVTHTMAGGIGASWHAIGPDVIHYPDLIGRDNRACKGSAYGGNPPVIPPFDQAWNDLLRHARWLGLDFIRVEVAMDMFEPERDRFSWDNDEMRTLYRILDHCQANGVDVYLTMMWQGVAWNAHPGINRLQSSPKSVADFANGYATLLERLVKTKGYTCIHWITVNNEPGMGVGWWQGPDGKADTIMPAIRALRADLDKRGLQGIAICGPDGHGITVAGFDPRDPAAGALSVHHYGGDVPSKMFRENTAIAAGRGIPFFLAEFGRFFMAKFEGDMMAMGGPRSETPKSYPEQLLNADKILTGLNLGVDGFNRWSFVNRGDLDGQWQLVRTWNPNRWDFQKRVEPEPVPYNSFGIISRFTAKHSAILATASGSDKVVATTLRSPKGQITLCLLNKGDSERVADIRVAGMAAPLALKRYQVTETALAAPNFRLEPLETHKIETAAPSLKLTLPAKSITTCTTYDLPADGDGAMKE